LKHCDGNGKKIGHPKIEGFENQKFPLRVPHSAITQRVGVMDEFLLCPKNTSAGMPGVVPSGYSYHGKEIGQAYFEPYFVRWLIANGAYPVLIGIPILENGPLCDWPNEAFRSGLLRILCFACHNVWCSRGVRHITGFWGG